MSVEVENIEEKKEEKRALSEEKLNAMFNDSFLPILKEVSDKKKESDEQGSEYIGYHVLLQFIYPQQGESLQFAHLENLDFKMQPLIKKKEENAEIPAENT